VNQSRILIPCHLVLVVNLQRLAESCDLQIDHSIAPEAYEPDRLRHLAIDPLFEDLAAIVSRLSFAELALRLTKRSQHHTTIHANQHLMTLYRRLDRRWKRLRIRLFTGLCSKIQYRIEQRLHLGSSQIRHRPFKEERDP